MTVRTTRTAEVQIATVDGWWRTNRAKAPDLFLDELADAFALIEAAPELGRPWTSSEVPGVRRVVMRATRYHVYYRIDGDDVVVLAVWSAVRGRGPRL
jgi:plasmid stabilization system protein ParE